MPTPEEIERARLAGWDPERGEPPEGWGAHGEPVPPLATTTDPTEALRPEERAALGLGEVLP